MFNRSKYGKVLKIVLIIFVIAIVGIIIVTSYEMYKSYYIATGAAQAVSKFEEAVKQGDITIKYKEFTVIGTIEIPKIDFKYPILQENSTEALETSVVLMYTSRGLNNEGNSVITGHNYRNGTMFSNLNKLAIGDYIYITDSTSRNLKYEIYDIYETTENEDSYITRNTNGKTEISLSTSSTNSKSKTIILAREK